MDKKSVVERFSKDVIKVQHDYNYNTSFPEKYHEHALRMIMTCNVSDKREQNEQSLANGGGRYTKQHYVREIMEKGINGNEFQRGVLGPNGDFSSSLLCHFCAPPRPSLSSSRPK